MGNIKFVWFTHYWDEFSRTCGVRGEYVRCKFPRKILLGRPIDGRIILARNCV
jgi:hypothetical protein